MTQWVFRAGSEKFDVLSKVGVFYLLRRHPSAPKYFYPYGIAWQPRPHDPDGDTINLDAAYGHTVSDIRSTFYSGRHPAFMDSNLNAALAALQLLGVPE